MSNNLDNERSVTSGKMYPIDLAPQKITIVKSVSNTEVKMAHLLPGQPKTSGSGQIMTHAGPVGLMRPAAQIISPSVGSQPQMIVSGSPILQGSQIVSQGSQLIGQGTQIISQSQLISPSGQILSPATQIISQGSQLSAQVSNNSTGSNNVQTSATPPVSGSQVLNVGGMVVSSSVRTLPPSVRVLSPLQHANTRPAVLSSVNVSTAGGVLVSKSVGMTSHVPRGLAAGASLAVRPVTPAASQGVAQGAWATSNRGARGALVYGGRTPAPRPASRPPAPVAAPLTVAPALSQTSLTSQPSHSTIVTLPPATVLTSSGVISGTVRGAAPRLQAPAATSTPSPRPLPLLQRNYQPKVVGVASVGVRGVVGNSAPAQLYYEVPRAAAPHAPRPLAPYYSQHQPPASTVSTVTVIPESRPPPTSVQTTPVVPRPSILRKRDIEGSPTKPTNVVPPAPVGQVSVAPVTLTPLPLPVSVNNTCYRSEGTWEDVNRGGGPGSGGSTTISASSSPAPDDEPDLPRMDDVSPRKKPRKQMLTNEVRQCDFTPDETPPTPPPVNINPPPKRPLLSSSYVCGWRGTALHFTRPADVRRREPRAKDILAIASQKHVLTSAEGWKVHHLTAQMDDLVSLEADVGEQLSGVLRALETASGRALSALQPHSHTLLELLKGNIQRSKIVCEGIQEAREDILRVFTHRNFVSEILTRQADKRCFRKHRSQS
ncbi:nascent polypeptide-associated complex subunit alpha, muscle-specific form isoform X2 [Ostrinia furnacalis]|uniref:nascent polypeptide-associated complex subunit alpha, muscle-specific form isoform X1 n=1 Tax=Ostrinia furnacalis TaxID=93504 RepID=UPI00103D8F0B|nr:nascent polypeptide-associated complex subunit alpha, muscle-specific form isoform X1 [Ostrinia furnacalis]XP_028178002.1 nascent polypeptide-associated complex subunit alpha, muscle-specific form isoform X2 [Ostrinia furnacalis]